MNEIILKLFDGFISHVITDSGYMYVKQNTEMISKSFQNNFISHITTA